jgi:tetratricopeptide (TPR) repeat protein
MFKKHPTVKNFEEFLHSFSGLDNTKRNARIIRHLLANCTYCRQRLNGMGWGEKRLERLLRVSSHERLVGAKGYNYEEAFARAEYVLSVFLTPERSTERSSEELLTALEELSVNEQERRAREEAYSSPQLIKLLIARSHAARYEDPEGMLHLALLARLAAEGCRAEIAGTEQRLADLRARAWGHYGNSLRVCGRLPEAEKALVIANRLREVGTGDPRLRARLLEQNASLNTSQRHFGVAIRLADEAGQIYRNLGETHLLASSMVHKAIASLYAGDADGAASILNRSIPLIDHEADPHLLLGACHNLVICYIDLARPELALSLYYDAHELYKEFSDAIILLRTCWQEGRLLCDLGHLQAAEAALLQCRKGLLARDMTYDVALVSLDLTEVYVKLRRVQEVQQLVEETVPIFVALRVGREALALLLQLQQVADQERQALTLIRSLASRLERVANRLLQPK